MKPNRNRPSALRLLYSVGPLVACLPALLLRVAHGAPQGDETTEAAPDYAAYHTSRRIRFPRPVDFRHLGSLHIRASLNGGKQTSFQVDTGSVGVIVSADEVPHIDSNAPAGFIRYSSSGLELDGVWTKTTLTFPDAESPDGHVVTAIVPVLAVTSEKVSGTGVNAITRPASAKPHPHMFGIGFGRGAEAHPERNPFLNLIEMQAGTMRRGYTITRDGYTLGLTTESTGPGYVFQKLKERTVAPDAARSQPKLKDWETAPGSLTVATATAPLGSVLIDTGLTNMMLAAPATPAKGELTPGTAVDISLLSGRLHYGFLVGDAENPATPRRVTWITPTHGVFVNTGLRALSLFDYLYDADGGYLALRPVTKP